MSTPRAQGEPVTDGGIRFERLLADLSARFVNLSPWEVDQVIEEGLRRIAEAMEVDRSTLMEFSEDEKELITTHQWAGDGIPRDMSRSVTEETRWYTTMLRRGEAINYSRLPEDLPDEAVAERRTARPPVFDPT